MQKLPTIHEVDLRSTAAFIGSVSGDHIAVTHDSRIVDVYRLLRDKEGHPLLQRTHRLTSPMNATLSAIASDGSWAATSDGFELCLWDLSSGRLTDRLKTERVWKALAAGVGDHIEAMCADDPEGLPIGAGALMVYGMVRGLARLEVRAGKFGPIASLPLGDSAANLSLLTRNDGPTRGLFIALTKQKPSLTWMKPRLMPYRIAEPSSEVRAARETAKETVTYVCSDGEVGEARFGSAPKVVARLPLEGGSLASAAVSPRYVAATDSSRVWIWRKGRPDLDLNLPRSFGRQVAIVGNGVLVCASENGRWLLVEGI